MACEWRPNHMLSVQHSFQGETVVLLRDLRPAHRAPLWASIARCIACLPSNVSTNSPHDVIPTSRTIHFLIDPSRKMI
ncbi:hypothetical protein GGI35DRAFT_445723 [Trichoderma velutinum]